jgi:tight adherence protein C
MTTLLGSMGTLLLCLALSVTSYVLAAVPAALPPTLGNRGVQRSRALAAGGAFALCEPLLRVLGGWTALLPIDGVRRKLDLRMLYAGHYLGLTADEGIAISALFAICGCALGCVWVTFSRASVVWVVMTTALGGLWFSLQLDLEVRRRRKEVDRQLPSAIDLLSLCVGAGSDFPSAVRFVLSEGAASGVLEHELEHVLQELELGHTRHKALSSLAERIPTDAVRDFVNSVCQAEAKGNPLAEVLEIQARMLRMRRSVAAEEAAAKAGVKMLLPLVLLMLCIMLILFGALMVKGMSGGL